MPASLVALPASGSVSGSPWRRRACVRKRRAASLCRCSDRRKSLVAPSLSTARARAPLALHVAARFVQPPPVPHRALAPGERLRQERALCDDPSVHRGVLSLHAPCLHAFLDVARAQRVGQRPAHPHQDDVLGARGACAADHFCSPSFVSSHLEREIIPAIGWE